MQLAAIRAHHDPDLITLALPPLHNTFDCSIVDIRIGAVSRKAVNPEDILQRRGDNVWLVTAVTEKHNCALTQAVCEIAELGYRALLLDMRDDRPASVQEEDD